MSASRALTESWNFRIGVSHPPPATPPCPPPLPPSAPLLLPTARAAESRDKPCLNLAASTPSETRGLDRTGCPDWIGQERLAFPELPPPPPLRAPAWIRFVPPLFLVAGLFLPSTTTPHPPTGESHSPSPFVCWHSRGPTATTRSSIPCGGPHSADCWGLRTSRRTRRDTVTLRPLSLKRGVGVRRGPHVSHLG